MKGLKKRQIFPFVAHVLGLLVFVWVAYYGCATAPQISPEEQAAMEAREKARQDSIRKFEVAKNWSLGRENYKNKEFDRVAPYFWKVIELDKERRFKDVYTFLGQTYFELGKVDSAELVYKLGLEVFPDNVFLNRSLGYIAMSKGDDEAAIKYYEKVVELKPNSLADWKRLAPLYAKNDMTEEAIRAYQKIIELDPNDAEARTILTALLRETGDEEAALQQMEEALQKSPDNKQLVFDLARAYMRAKDWQKAEEKLKYYLQLDPNDIVIREDLARVYQRQERFQDALQEYKNILKIDPNNVRAVANVAYNYMRLGQFKTARNWAKRAIRMDKNYGFGYIVLGRIYEQTIEDCKKKAGRDYNFDDKLVAKLAYDTFKKALGDIEFKQEAEARMRSLEPILPTQADYFMNKGKTKPTDPCYTWIYQ